MSTVTRLEWEACDAHNCHCDIVESKDGDMVNYEDYAALEKKLTDMAVQLANAESKCRELASESDKTSERMQQLIQIINNADNNYCMCGDAMKNHTYGGCGHPTGMFDYHYGQWMKSDNQTPATDAFLAEVRASELDSLAGVAETMLVKFSNQSCSSDMHEVVGWKMVLQQATNRAAQLRKGAAL